ncbi:glycosyltransferase 87 family protein [Streptomyces sp. NPDC058001]|uniref:glycosyltransferase 87 family protein n=1 Tax=Streptomyces sp. NPDC058001 TaxID=3346300 RepID=UPI0036F1581C
MAPVTGRTTGGRIALAVLAVAATGVFLVTVPLFREWFDLAVYDGAVGYWVHDGGSLYDFVVPGTRYGFTYPPFAAVCMLPMAWVNWPLAVMVSVALNVAASAAVLYWLVWPVIRRQAWCGWFAVVLAVCLFLLLEPVHDTFTFGQVNLILLALVLADVRLLSTRFARYAGIGIGVAAAVKLTPVVFIGYLLLTRRRRAALVAASVAVGGTVLAAWADLDASRYYWTKALWDTTRVGDLTYVSNQSWQGVVARYFDPSHPSRAVWAVGVAVLLAVWARRVRAAGRDDRTGVALTGLLACLISPITWVHHLVWAVPALIALTEAGLRQPRRRGLLLAAAGAHVLLCSSLVWLWRFDFAGVTGFLGSNAYVWLCAALLLFLPLREMPSRTGASGPQPVQLRADRAA